MDPADPEAPLRQSLPRYLGLLRLTYSIDREYKPGRSQNFDVYTQRPGVPELITFQALLIQINPC